MPGDLGMEPPPSAKTRKRNHATLSVLESQLAAALKDQNLSVVDLKALRTKIAKKKNKEGVKHRNGRKEGEITPLDKAAGPVRHWAQGEQASTPILARVGEWIRV